jgi:predicted dehydrogenase
MSRALKLGFVGGAGRVSIGSTHRAAARIDGEWQIVAGVFSRDEAKNRAAAAEFDVEPSRTYPDFAALIRAERARPDGIDALVVITPNVTHHAICRAAIEAGLHVICDKPIAVSLAEARDLVAAVARAKTVFAVTHGFAAYPMVREARRLVRNNELGAIRLIEAEFLYGWMATPVEATDPRAAWRLDPAEAGPGGILADIGTHAFHLSEFVGGARAQSVLAEVATILPGRRLDDDVRAWLRFENGARGNLRVGTTAIGSTSLRIRVFGERGGLDWSNAAPDTLQYSRLGEPTRILVRGALPEGPATRLASRIGPGHPEGLIAAFADIYREAASAIRERRPLSAEFADVRAGAAGLAFIEAALASQRHANAWTEIQRV